MKMEFRFNEVELEVENKEETLMVTGYANKTNQLSEVLGVRKRFREKVLPGTFTRAIEGAKNDIHMLASHDDSKVLSSTRNGSLRLFEDNIGLKVEARISPTTYGKDTYQLVKDGILNNMSFGMIVNRDEWQNTDEVGIYERTISDLTLFEVSIVRDPAYSQTTISARGIENVEEAVPDSFIEAEEEEVRMNEELAKEIREGFEKLKTILDTIQSDVSELKDAEKREDPKEPEEKPDEKAGEPDVPENKDPEVEPEEGKPEGDQEEKKTDEEVPEVPKVDEPEDPKEPEEKPDESRSVSTIQDRLNKLKGDISYE